MSRPKLVHEGTPLWGDGDATTDEQEIVDNQGLNPDANPFQPPTSDPPMAGGGEFSSPSGSDFVPNPTAEPFYGNIEITRSSSADGFPQSAQSSSSSSLARAAKSKGPTRSSGSYQRHHPQHSFVDSGGGRRRPSRRGRGSAQSKIVIGQKLISPSNANPPQVAWDQHTPNYHQHTPNYHQHTPNHHQHRGSAPRAVSVGPGDLGEGGMHDMEVEPVVARTIKHTTTTNITPRSKFSFIIGAADKSDKTTPTESRHRQNAPSAPEGDVNHDRPQGAPPTTPLSSNDGVVTIGEETSFSNPERMLIDDIIPKSPLVAVDGANVAYAYAEASMAAQGIHIRDDEVFLPDVRGIELAVQYFQRGHCRVRVFLPTVWLNPQSKINQGSSTMVTEDFLKSLGQSGILLTSPAGDDDDAYAIRVALDEDARARKRATTANNKISEGLQGGGGFVLSNDKFRDKFNAFKGLQRFLEFGHGAGPGRIPYTFGDIGSLDEFGDPFIDLIPSCAHPLVRRIDEEQRQGDFSPMTA